MEFSNLPTVVKKINFEIEEKYKKQIIKNLCLAIFFILMLLGLNLLSKYNIDKTLVVNISKTFSAIIFITGLVLLEKSYRKKSISKCFFGIEYIIYSFLCLKLIYDFEFFQNKFYINLAYIESFICLYFVIKIFIYYSIASRTKYSDVSDIKEIIKYEPIKKKATRKHIKQEIKVQKDEIQEEKNIKLSKKEQAKQAEKQRIKETLNNDKTLIAISNLEQKEEKISNSKDQNKKIDSKTKNTKNNSKNKKEQQRAKTPKRYTKVSFRQKSILDQKMKQKNK